ncbi:MAG: PQQ-binding-like beta-propeller repeat protein [Verrucomicrobia bacterium]|nr:PQQ-binding-like beta-propeller repeat protein [Verrucomicrobiota bacterium]
MTKMTFAFSTSFIATLAAAALAHAADWPQYRGPNLDGSTSEKIAAKWPLAGPKALWKATTTDGFSSFSVSGGQAFTLVMREVEGVAQEACIALDANTGKEQWMAPLGTLKLGDGGQAGTKENGGGDGPRSTPTVSEGRVYVMSAKLVLSCLDAKTGKLAWQKDLLKDFAGRNISWQNAASPLIEGGLVYVAGGGAGQSIIAFNKQTGAVAWKSHDEKITHSTPVAATIHGVRQVIFFCQSGLVSVAAKDGRLLWKRPFKFAVSTAMTPIVAGDLVFCSAGYGVGGGAARVSKDASGFKAEEIWFVAGSAGPDAVANHWSTPVHKDGHLYGMFQFKEYGSGPMKCVELATGKVKWSKPGFGPGNVILVGDNVVALSDAGELVVVEATASGYKEVSSARAVVGKCWSTPVVSNGRLYVRSTKEAACLDVSAKTTQR